MSDSINNSWQRILAWMQAGAPDDLALLQGPVERETLDAAAAHFKVTFPDDFAQLYGLMNGTDPDGDPAGIFPSVDEWDTMAFGPLALEQIIREWDTQKELLEMGDFAGSQPRSEDGVANDWWNLGWIPFASNGGGDFYCVDLAATDAGTIGQVITHSHDSGKHKVLAPSLAAYLRELADGLDAGLYEYTDCGMQKVEA